jgi:hypothetical protein
MVNPERSGARLESGARRKVLGALPTPSVKMAANFGPVAQYYRPISSVVERLSDTQEVTGAIPVLVIIRIREVNSLAYLPLKQRSVSATLTGSITYRVV